MKCIISRILNFFGKIVPKSRMRLPFMFQQSNSFKSKKITGISIILLMALIYSASMSLQQIGYIEDTIRTQEEFQSNF